MPLLVILLITFGYHGRIWDVEHPARTPVRIASTGIPLVLGQSNRAFIPISEKRGSYTCIPKTGIGASAEETTAVFLQKAGDLTAYFQGAGANAA